MYLKSWLRLSIIGTNQGYHVSGTYVSNWVIEQTQLHMLKFEPQAYMHRISPTLLLRVNQGNDVIKTSSQLETFGKAHESNAGVVLGGSRAF